MLLKGKRTERAWSIMRTRNHKNDSLPLDGSMLTPFRDGTVVVFTQNPELASVVSHAVGGLGMHAPRLSTVRTLKDCLVAVRLVGPSLVVLDDAASVPPGPVALDELLAARPGTPVIYVAAQHTLELEREVRRRGVLFYIAMPESSEVLDSTLVQLLGKLAHGKPRE